MLATLLAAPGCARDLAHAEAATRPAPATPPADAGSRAHTEVIELTPEGLVTAQVTVERASPDSFAPHLRIAAEIQADPQRMAHVGARSGGRIVAIAVHLGDAVRRGQAIAEIDTVELHQVSMEFLTSIARSRQANDNLTRQQELVRERVGAQADLRRAEADAAAASAALREGEEHLHFLGLTEGQIRQLRARTSHGEARSTVRAPIDGRVEGVHVSLGQVVSGTEDLVTLAQLDTVWASMRVYERDAVDVRTGTTVEITTPGAPGVTFRGTVAFVSSIVDPITRTFEARVSLANAEAQLRPGMSATATVAVRSATSQLWVPVEAVQAHEGDRVVFVQLGDRRFGPRTVRVGEERNGWVPVLEGIAAGDPVVVRGAFMLRGELERAALEEE
ncbi:MAG: efflux RND transporter periplasmic adaptor subunit [Deltaproteobacteria bacterium]